MDLPTLGRPTSATIFAIILLLFSLKGVQSYVFSGIIYAKRFLNVNLKPVTSIHKQDFFLYFYCRMTSKRENLSHKQEAKSKSNTNLKVWKK